MDSIQWWARKGEAVRQAIEVGEMAHIETAREEGTEELLLFASESGLVKSWAESFPDPRGEPELAMEGIVPAHSAARFAGLYSMRNAGDVLRSARVGGAWGYRVEVVEPARGLAWRGTADDPLLSGAVVRKLVVQMAQQVDVRQPVLRPPQEPRATVKVRERASRRAVKHGVDDAEAAVRAQKGAEPLVDWDNQPGGARCCSMGAWGEGDGFPCSIRLLSRDP